jgi:hypothetical protein
VRKQRIPIMTTSALGFIAMCITTLMTGVFEGLSEVIRRVIIRPGFHRPTPLRIGSVAVGCAAHTLARSAAIRSAERPIVEGLR